METRNLICISCPLGCPLKVELRDGKVERITGNSCKRGAIYGEKEVTNPTRIVTTTVRVEGAEEPVVPVKTAEDIPKGKIFDCIYALREICLKAPIHIGDVVIKNVADTGVDIVATKEVF